MKKPLIITLVVLVAAVLLGYFIFASPNDEEEPTTTDTSQTQPSDTEDTLPEEEAPDGTQPTEAETVTIDNREYVQDSITIKKGTTVTWTNEDSQDHDVTPDEETDEFKQSQMLSNGETYSVTFNTPGTYTYHCSPHPDMTGTVVVTE